MLPNRYMTDPQLGQAFVYVSTIQRMTINLFGRDAVFGLGDESIDEDAKKLDIESSEYEYTERDVILYNLGIGATEKELQWTFESDDNFSAIPTFGVIPQFMASSTISLDWLPNYNPVSLLFCA